MNPTWWIATVVVAAVTSFFVGRRSTRDASQPVAEQPMEQDPVAFGGQFETLVDHLPMGVTLFGQTGELRYRNEIARVMSGVRHIDALVADATERLAAHGPGETQLNLTGPPARNYALSASRLDSGDVVVFVWDVTSRDRLESMRRDFVANLSHELKTPLGGMAALSDSMVGETDQSVIARLAERIATEAQRMSEVIDDLLDLSRIESRADIHFEETDMATIVNEAISLQRLNSELAGIGLKSDVPRLNPIRVDRAQMLSAVSNLIENAIKYSERGAMVTVTLRDGDTVTIEVVDEGIGISQDDLERVFERFYRVDRARSRATGGTGLGLAIAKHAVENNGGSISVSSVEGQGSTFAISLPRGGAQ
jgi:two-component system sensor histidine kinase SenX3